MIEKNKKFLEKVTEKDLEILNKITGGNIDAIINIVDLETALTKYKIKEDRSIKLRKAMEEVAPKLKARKQPVKYTEDPKDLDYMEKGIEIFFKTLETPGTRLYKQINNPRNADTLILNKMYERLTETLDRVLYLRENGTTEECFREIQQYYKLSYTGALDSIGSYTLYLLLTYTDISLPQAQRLTGIEGKRIDKGGLSKVRSRKRWESLHEDGFLTEYEKAVAIKDFKEIAVNYNNYDLSMTSPVKNRIN